MPWLTRGERVLASVERGRGWPTNGAAVLRCKPLLLRAGGRAAVDLAWCRPVQEGCAEPGGPVAGAAADVLDVLEVRRLSVSARCWPVRPTWAVPVLIVAERGAVARWGLAVGDRVEVRGG